MFQSVPNEMYERTVELRLLQKIRTFTFSSRMCSGLSETGFSIATRHKTWILKKITTY